MSSATQNLSIARLIVGAMTIDGSLDKGEREKVATTLDRIGMGELIAYVGAALDEDSGDFNLYEECKTLRESLGAEAAELIPLVFRVVVDVVASDRFVSSREASYLSALSRRLEISTKQAQQIFKQVLAERHGRLEVAGSKVDSIINPNLKDLLSFDGADSLVGALDPDSLDALAEHTDAMAEGEKVSYDELQRALAILGLDGNAKVKDAEGVWRETINTLDLPKMAQMGETFVSAAINRISRINEAYKTVLHYQTQKTSLKAA